MQSKEMMSRADEIFQDIAWTATHVERDWPGVIEADDANQDIWVWILERDGALEHLTSLDRTHRLNALRWLGMKIGATARDDYEWFSGNVYYGTNDVREILDRGVSPEEEQLALWEQATPIPEAAPQESPDSVTLTEQMDLSEGLAAMRIKNPWLTEVLEAKFFRNERVYTHRQEVTRAVDLLTKCMNNVHKERQRKVLNR